MIKRESIQKMLDDVEFITTRQFYIGVNHSPGDRIHFYPDDGDLDVVGFVELPPSDRFELLNQRVKLYEGISQEHADRIFENVVNDLPRSQWLEGTGLYESQSFDQGIAKAASRQIPDRDKEIER